MKKILVSNREAEGKGSKESNPEWHRRLGWLQHNPWKLMFSEKDGFEQGASIGSLFTDHIVFSKLDVHLFWGRTGHLKLRSSLLTLDVMPDF